MDCLKSNTMVFGEQFVTILLMSLRYVFYIYKLNHPYIQFFFRLLKLLVVSWVGERFFVLILEVLGTMLDQNKCGLTKLIAVEQRLD